MIIGKPITALMQGGGLQPIIVVTAPTGSTVQLDGVTGTEVSGTWTFTTTLGTHTISATLGAQSKTVSVVVSSVAAYSVTIVYQLYLYNEGEQYTSLTGGWSSAYKRNTNGYYDSTGTVVFNSDNIKITANGSRINTATRTINAIDITNFSRIYFNVTNVVYSNERYTELGADTAITVNDANMPKSVRVYNGNSGDFYADISELTGAYYVIAYANHGSGLPATAETVIHKVWLE